MTALRELADKYGFAGVLNWTEPHGAPGREDGSEFMGYDGVNTTEPVNQIPDLHEMRGHAAKLMRHLFEWMGNHASEIAGGAREATVYNYYLTLIGYSLYGYDKYAKIAPWETAIGDDGVERFKWKVEKAKADDLHEYLCGTCEDEHFVDLSVIELDSQWDEIGRLLNRGVLLGIVPQDPGPWHLGSRPIANARPQQLADGTIEDIEDAIERFIGTYRALAMNHVPWFFRHVAGRRIPNHGVPVPPPVEPLAPPPTE